VPGIRTSEITEELNDVWGLVVGYTKQEVRSPLRGLGSFMGWGAAGMLCFALATGLGVLAILRAFQTESDLFNAYWSWVPYAVALFWCIVIGGLGFRSVKRTPWKKEGDAK
jgi:hypothetical protein